MQHVFNKVLIFLTFNIQILRLCVASVYNVQDQVGPTLPLPLVPNAPNIQSLRFNAVPCEHLLRLTETLRV